MKKCIHNCLLLCFLLLSQALFANTLIVKGYIRDSAGAAVPYRTVKIYTDSTSQGCAISHTKITNPNGYYIDTLTCTGDIRKIRIIVENCNGSLIVNEPALTTSGIIESNFVICKPTPIVVPPTGCKAAFTFSVSTSVPGTNAYMGVKFNSSVSAPSTIAGDSIVSRTWYFGDSSYLSGNTVDPTHAYKKAGIYIVYLLIKTAKGCESKYAAEVVLPGTPTCAVQIYFTAEKLSYKRFRFNSSHFSIVQGDTIIQRNWKFGDGTTLSGNEISPLKEYKDTGLYTICLAIKTSKGCEKEYCASLRVTDSVPPVVIPTGCKAVFTYTIQRDTVQFSSAASSASSAPGDSIISRTWFFGDIVVKGNEVTPMHIYPKPGTYYVYLLIKTQKGCESKYYTRVVIPAQPVCKVQVQFGVEMAGQRRVYFNSGLYPALADDSIAQRKWSFGDGSYLSGNEARPVKTYLSKGNYMVCLNVKTAKGCEGSICRSVAVIDSIPVPPPYTSSIRIVGINPNPVTTRLVATVWSKTNNQAAEIAIYDIYGVVKVITRKVLSEGNNLVELNTESLYKGPYFLRVSAPGGKDSRTFYKF